MLTDIYIEDLLVDKELADQVWEAWDLEKTEDAVALLAWLMGATRMDCATQGL